MKPSEQNTPSRAPLPATPQTFILEPILTPSGIIDAGDDGVDLAIADLDFDVDSTGEPPLTRRSLLCIFEL